jgi:integrase
MKNPGAAPRTQPQRVKLLGGTLTLYSRPNTSVWWACFHYKNRLFRSSTKSSDMEAAKKAAQEWFFEKRQQISSGVAPASKARSFRHAAEVALEEYSLDAGRGRRSKQYVSGLTKLMRLVNERIGDLDITCMDQGAWNNLKRSLGALSERTIHQWKNAVMIVLKQAMTRGDLKAMPIFVRETNGNHQDTPRTFFNVEECKTLVKALKENIGKHRRDKTRHIEGAEELKDFVTFGWNTGLRVGEEMNVRFCDVTIAREKGGEEYLEVRSILGKRGRTGVCKSFFGAVPALKRCVERHGLTLENYSQSEQLVFSAYHRDMFREVLKGAGLYRTNDRPPLKRDLKSLRSTYICHCLMNGAPVYDVANNVRTSVQMVETHYAKHLSVLSSSTINRRLQPAGTDEGIADDQ